MTAIIHSVDWIEIFDKLDVSPLHHIFSIQHLRHLIKKPRRMCNLDVTRFARLLIKWSDPQTSILDYVEGRLLQYKNEKPMRCYSNSFCLCYQLHSCTYNPRILYIFVEVMYGIMEKLTLTPINACQALLCILITSHPNPRQVIERCTLFLS